MNRATKEPRTERTERPKTGTAERQQGRAKKAESHTNQEEQEMAWKEATQGETENQGKRTHREKKTHIAPQKRTRQRNGAETNRGR